ncbi:inositol monophosphatase family protein [Phycicoccus sp. Soil802]|uniref:inositol monophosphatase family protein n=1 Tax=Phycicoccus sp. Soil802 TaxID=1736414 RepID=UPI0007033199|nr:inositol monophosphatase family protein [Phycicoccus sp. Soil802]KRF29674.1 inositol monophosphatase [Phycicoccus sp. Soil802]
MDLATPDLSTPDDATLEGLEALAVEVAVEAGRLIVDERPPNLGVSKTKSTATDVVTVMDQRAQDLLRTRLQEARPQDGFLGEEEGGTDGRSAITWVVDPIDGTVNYLYGIPSYSVSVAAVVGDPTVPGAWRPVAGAVFNPVTGELFRARAGGGARLEGGRAPERRLELAEPPSLGHALVGTGFGYDTARRQWQATVLMDVLPEVRDIRRIGSAALDICAVAAGSLDAYYERGLNPWDMAAAWLVLVEAGGVFSGLGGEPPSDRMVVAAAPTLHTALHEVVLRAAERAGTDSTL